MRSTQLRSWAEICCTSWFSWGENVTAALMSAESDKVDASLCEEGVCLPADRQTWRHWQFQKQTDCLWPWWIPHCDCGVTKHASQSLSDGEFPNMPLTEQRRPGSVKAHGKARPARHRGTTGLRKEGSVSVPSLPGPSRGMGRTGWWETPGGLIPWPTLTTPPLFNTASVSLNQTSLVFSRSSVCMLSVSVCLFFQCFFFFFASD